MPTYIYECKACSHHWEEVLYVDERKQPLDKPCPECEAEKQIVMLMGAPSIGDPVRLGRVKPPSDFRDRIKQIKKATPKNNLPDF